MKLLCTTMLVLFSFTATFGQIYTGPIPKPTSGYGADGSHTIGVVSFTNPYFPTENIVIYHPSDITTPVPTLFYSHAFGGSFPFTVQGLLDWTAKKGFAIVFVPYQTTGVGVRDRYENLLEGFRKAARDYPDIIDTTRVGFLGHSFGGGAIFATAYACFTENNWGTNGRMMHSSAPWYLFNISQAELNNFPSDTKLIVEIYNDDPVNDHRMAADAFVNIGIPDSEKDFITVFADSSSGYAYTAQHDLPMGYTNFDAMDYYAYYRLIDALADYTFNGSLAGKAVALGNGSTSQVAMPTGLANLVVTDSPIVAYPESNFGFPCSAFANPREAYCNAVLSTAEVLVNRNHFLLYPNPTADILHISSDKPLSKVDLLNDQGLLVKTTNASRFSVSAFPAGLYFIKVTFDDGSVGTGKVVKE